jgi:hypothetical protein
MPRGDGQNEAAQLREYLKFSSDPNDAAMVKQYLSELEKRGIKELARLLVAKHKRFWAATIVGSGGYFTGNHFIHIAPDPVLSGFNGTHHGMSTVPKMFGGMFIL